MVSARSSSSTGPWPHHWPRRCDSTRVVSPSRSRYSNNDLSIFAAPPYMCLISSGIGKNVGCR
ncbi:Uncharacterised protein [Bordetella pertussis]|nr:Uncharacterised protein [Bordetella pertussis]